MQLILDGQGAAAAAAALAPPPHPSTSQINLLRRRERSQTRRLCGGPPLLSHAICTAADMLITSLLPSHQLHPASDPRVQLRGNSFPVPETPPTPCSVAGTLPADLNGAYIRNGPNAAHMHHGEPCHFFDGDGMLHSVKISHGTATYCARYVKTSRFVQEEAAGRPLFPKFLGSFTNGFAGLARFAVMFLRASLGLVDLSQGLGLSNTSLGFFKGQVLSMSEEDLPYVIKVTESGDLVTQERLELPGKSSMCAHPKFDAETGDMYAFSYPSACMAPYSIFKVRARNGEKSDDVRVPQLFDMPFVHDFAITRNYVVFPDSELVVRPLRAFLRGEALVAKDTRKAARFCVLPRDIFDRPHKAAQEALWFDAPGCNCLHYVNAWDDDESQEIVLIAPVVSPAGDNLLSLTDVSSSVREIRLNTQTGSVTSRALSCGGNFEMGTMNQRYVGRKSRYAYFAEGISFPHEMTAVVKVDVEARCIISRRTFGVGCNCGEPYFVSRHHMVKESLVCHSSDPQQNAESEDDGYLLCFVHNNHNHCSQLLVMDALSPSLDIIADIKLHTRVPFGLHGLFVSDFQLGLQNA